METATDIIETIPQSETGNPPLEGREAMLNKILYGKKKPLTLPTGEKRMAQYVIVDLDEIKASHNEETFADTDGYPLNSVGRNINDRNYKNDTAAQQTVMNIAQNLDADKLIEYSTGVSGTPIIDKSGIVVSGNNRIMSLKLAAKKYPDQYKNYVETLAREADTFGFTESGIVRGGEYGIHAINLSSTASFINALSRRVDLYEAINTDCILATQCLDALQV